MSPNEAALKVLADLAELSPEELGKRIDEHESTGIGEAIMYAKDPEFYKKAYVELTIENARLRKQIDFIRKIIVSVDVRKGFE